MGGAGVRFNALPPQAVAANTFQQTFDVFILLPHQLAIFFGLFCRGEVGIEQRHRGWHFWFGFGKVGIGNGDFHFEKEGSKDDDDDGKQEK